MQLSGCDGFVWERGDKEEERDGSGHNEEEEEAEKEVGV